MEFALDYIMKNVDYFQSRLSEGVFRDGIHISFICSINQWNRDSIYGILKKLNYKLSEEKGKNQNRGTIEQRRKKCRNQMIFFDSLHFYFTVLYISAVWQDRHGYDALPCYYLKQS